MRASLKRVLAMCSALLVLLASTVLVILLVSSSSVPWNNRLRYAVARRLKAESEEQLVSRWRNADSEGVAGEIVVQDKVRASTGINTATEEIQFQKGALHTDHLTAGRFVAPPERNRVALLFFGLPRSLKYTLPSIQTNILQRLQEAGYRPTIFLHTYANPEVDARSKGSAPDEWKALDPSKHSVTNQTEFLVNHREGIQACLKHGTGWPAKSEKEHTRNHVCQLKSVEEVGQLWEHHYHKEEFAAVAYLRPDVLYNEAFPVELIPHLKENEVFVPAWAENRGINDRFALLHPATASVWKGRLHYTLDHCLDKPIHSETFLQHFTDFSGLEACPYRLVHRQPGFTFFRVRANGQIAPGDKELPGYDAVLQTIQHMRQEEEPQAVSVA